MRRDETTLTDALEAIACAIQRLGNADATTPFGGLEALGMVLEKGMESMASAIYNLAEAIRERDEN